MQIDQTVQQVHALAVTKGWWDWEGEQRQPLALHMLMVTEVAEASEQVRDGNPEIWLRHDGKPEGEAIELADCVIRIMDYFGRQGWSLEKALRMKMEFNEGRPHRHGGKTA